MHPNTTDTLEVAVDCAGNQWTLAVSGNLDLATGRQLMDLGKVLGEGQPGSVSLDLSGIDFVDTAGLHAVARTCAMVKAAGGITSITGTSSPAVVRLLDALQDCGLRIDLTDQVRVTAKA